MRPIAEVIADEQAAARARLHEQRERELQEAAAAGKQQAVVERRFATYDAVEARAQEGQMVRAARANAMGLIATCQRLLRGANKLSEKVEEKLKNEDVKLSAATALFHQIASTTRAANEAARLAQQMERSLLGEPESWVGLHVDSMSDAEAIAFVEQAARSIERAKRLGLVETPGEEVDAPSALAPKPGNGAPPPEADDESDAPAVAAASAN